MFEQLVQRLVTASADQRLRASTDGLNNLRQVLATEPEVRFYMPATLNLGHQASTMNLIERMAYLKLVGGAKRYITLVYEKGDVATGLTADKLALLLTDFDKSRIEEPRYCVSIGETRVPMYFCALDALGEAPVRLAGLTGGADHGHRRPRNFAKELRVKVFLRLQPYLWDFPDEIQFGRDGIDAIRLDTNTALGTNFKRRSYSVRAPVVPAATWAWFEGHGSDAARRRVTLAHLVANTMLATGLQLMPMYGIRTANQMRREPREPLVQLATALLTTQKTVVKPTVMLNFDKLTDDDLTALKSLLAGGMSKSERDLLEEEMWLQDEAKTSSESKRERIAKRLAAINGRLYRMMPRRKLLGTLGAHEKVAIVTAALSPQELRAKLDELVAAGRGVLLLQLGSVPPAIYNYFYSLPGPPSVFEGQATAAVAIHIGKPYLQMRGYDAPPIVYPSAQLTATNNDPPAVQAAAAAEAVTTGFDNSIDNAFITANERVSRFILDGCFAPKQPLVAYFERLSAFYDVQANDKAVLGLIFFGWVLNTPK